MATHTPGPWTVFDYEPQECRDCRYIFTPQDGESLCADCGERDRRNAEDDAAAERGALWSRDRLEDDL